MSGLIRDEFILINFKNHTRTHSSTVRRYRYSGVLLNENKVQLLYSIYTMLHTVRITPYDTVPVLYPFVHNLVTRWINGRFVHRVTRKYRYVWRTSIRYVYGI